MTAAKGSFLDLMLKQAHRMGANQALLDCLITRDRARSNEAVKERSGEKRSDKVLVAFLYLLIRDHLPAGTVEQLASEVSASGAMPASFTNGWLAGHAEDIARSLAPEVFDDESEA